MHAAEAEGRRLDEAEVAGLCREMLDAAASRHGTVIFVSNEVGMGIVPENAQARRYRDLVGRANQVIAARAATVTLVSCGIPLPLEGGRPSEPVGNDACGRLPPRTKASARRAKERLDQLIMPHWALGRLMDLAVDLAGMTRSLPPGGARRPSSPWPAITAWRPRA